jgi:hypothetical protein
MDLKLHLLESFTARGNDAREYKVCAYERMVPDQTVHDGQDRWLSTGVTEYRLASGELLDVDRAGLMKVVATGVQLTPV